MECLHFVESSTHLVGHHDAEFGVHRFEVAHVRIGRLGEGCFRVTCQTAVQQEFSSGGRADGDGPAWAGAIQAAADAFDQAPRVRAPAASSCARLVAGWPVSWGIASLTPSSSPAAIAVYVDTQAATCQSGAP